MNSIFLLKYFFVNFLLIFGILNPKGFIDVFISYFLLGNLLIYFLRYQFEETKRIDINTKKILYAIFLLSIILSLLSISIWKPDFFNIAALSLILGITLSTLLFLQISKRPIILVFSVILIFIFTSVINSGDLRRSISFEPAAETYFRDYFSFLKVFYLVERGYDYYPAHVKAHHEDARFDYVPQQIWGWRLPTYAYLWAAFPGSGGVSIYIFFIVLSSMALFFSYEIAKIFIDKNLSVLSPYLIFPYFHFAARDVAFLEMEWWSVCFMILGIYYFIRKKLLLATLLLIMTVLVRETFVIPMILIAIISLASKRFKHFFYLFSVGIIFIGFLIFHFLMVTEYIPRSIKSLEPRDHPIGLFFLQQTFSYGSWEYLLFNLRPFLLLSLLNLISGTILFIRKRFSFELTVLLISAFSLLIAALKIGTPPFDDYWGAAFVPLILITTPIVLLKLLSEN